MAVLLRLTTTLLLVALLPACGDSDSDSGAGSGSEDVPAAVAATADTTSGDVDARSPSPEGVGGAATGSRQGAGGDADASLPDGGGAAPPATARPPQPPPVRIPDDPPTFTRPEHVRGIYVNKWSAGSPGRLAQLLELARTTEVNSFVVDLKDVTGLLSYSSAVPLAREIGAVDNISVSDMPALLRRLREEGVYPIARIVIVKDPVLAAARPDLTVQDTSGGQFADDRGTVWLNPYNDEVWEYNLDLAREAAAMGFPEVQWDYVRFPDLKNSEVARTVYPGRNGRSKVEVVEAFLDRADSVLAELDVVHAADVFGVTTSAGDIGIGQVWESFMDELDVALPMIYPSHYWRGSFGIERPNAHPYEIVTEALVRGIRRAEKIEDAARIVPWLQDFNLGEPDYGAPEVRAQMQAAYDLGIHEWILWHPGSRYTEEALEPVGGWREEPLIRVAGEVVPVSRRFEALGLADDGDEEAAVEAADDETPGPAWTRDASGVWSHALPPADPSDSVTVRQLRSGVWMHTTWREMDGVTVPSNGLLAETGEGLWLVSTAWGEAPTRALTAWVEEELGRALDGAVVTHFHDDAMGGMPVLRERGVEAWAHPLTLWLGRDQGVPLPRALESLQEGDRLVRLGDLEVFYPGPAHTRDNLVVWLPGERVLFGGCAVRPGPGTPLGGSLGNVADADVEAWPASARRILERYGNAAVVVPSHGPPGGVELLEHTIRLGERAGSR